MPRAGFIFALIALLCSCATVPPVYQRQVAFDPAQHAPYEVAGDAAVSGQAFIRATSGQVYYGHQVALLPVTDYTREFYQVTVLEDRASSPHDPRLDASMRRATCDGEGRFAFESIPAGEYYLITIVAFQNRHHISRAPSTDYRRLHAQVQVEPGQTLEVLLTP